MNKDGWQKPLWLANVIKGYHDVVITKLDAVLNLFESASDADFNSEDLLAGKKAFNGTTLITGTMTDNGAKTATLAAGGSYTIPEGYHNGSGVVNATSLSAQTSATATASQILSGKTAWVNGSKLTGNMSNKAGTTVTASSSKSGAYAYLTVPSTGYYDTSSKLKALLSNIYPNNHAYDVCSKNSPTASITVPSGVYDGYIICASSGWRATSGGGSFAIEGNGIESYTEIINDATEMAVLRNTLKIYKCKLVPGNTITMTLSVIVDNYPSGHLLLLY